MGGAPYGGDSLAGQTGGKWFNQRLGNTVPYLFQVRNMFFLGPRYWPLSIPAKCKWSLLNFRSSPFWSDAIAQQLGEDQAAASSVPI
jgi:hypothetical protein